MMRQAQAQGYWLLCLVYIRNADDSLGGHLLGTSNLTLTITPTNVTTTG